MTRVLLLDDDALFRQTMALILSDQGYSCLEAASSADARRVLDANPDVVAVLCDITMPGQSGIALLRDLTADCPDLAVIMVTATDDAHRAAEAFAAGAFGYLIKPFDDNELLISLASALKRRDLESSQRAHVRALEEAVGRTRALRGLLDGIEDQPTGAVMADEEVIERLSRLVSLRDEETGRHIERMSRYAIVLADAVGFTAVPRDDLRVAIALHDVGKIGVPDSLLLKPGALSPDEHAAMQRHAQIGYQLLAGSSSRVLRLAAEIARAHHEWWDGSGYPLGLHGEEIGEESRIAAVADVFDALTSNRVYRPAMSFAEAIVIMTALRGRQFEPRLLDGFLDKIDAIAAIRAAYPDQDEGEARIRVLVVDDHEIFAHSLVRLLETRVELKVVGTAETVADAVVTAVAYEPDVILMDFELPDGDGAQATEQIKSLTPAVKVIMLTARTDDDALVAAIAAGCSGFVKKEDTVESLFDAIVGAHAGEAIVAPAELGVLLRRLRPTHRGLGATLTPRELEVLGLLAAGLVNKEIAERLGLRLNTVRNHVQKILNTLNVHSKLEAVATAVREGIVGYPSEIVRA